MFDVTDGANILGACTYDQTSSSLVNMVNATQAVFNESAAGATSKLLIVLSDGRGVYNEGKAKVQEAVNGLISDDVFVIFMIVENLDKESVLDMKVVNFDEAGMPKVEPYLDTFPFPYYMILRDVEKLPHSLSSAVRQWFELLNT